MRFIELPIKVSVYDEQEIKKLDSLGIPYNESEARDGVIKVNPNHIVAYLEIESGKLDIELVSGTRLTIEKFLEDFGDLLYD